MTNLFNKAVYTAEDLISLLLPKLQERGIRKITEEELSRDLYYYSQQPKFKDLFIDISKKKTEDGLDIYNAMFMEKYIACTIQWSDMKPTKLSLSYPNDLNLHSMEQLLTNEGLLLVNTIADELSVKYKIQSISKNKMSIYNVDPNCDYTLIYGNNRLGRKIGWELLTDGDIKTLEPLANKSYSCERPIDIGNRTTLTDITAKRVSIEDASYAVMQGSENDMLKGVMVYTNLTDLNSLEQISRIANIEYHETGNLLLEDAPYVRKIVLR